MGAQVAQALGLERPDEAHELLEEQRQVAEPVVAPPTVEPPGVRPEPREMHSLEFVALPPRDAEQRQMASSE